MNPRTIPVYYMDKYCSECGHPYVALVGTPGAPRSHVSHYFIVFGAATFLTVQGVRKVSVLVLRFTTNFVYNKINLGIDQERQKIRPLHLRSRPRVLFIRVADFLYR